MIATAKLNYKYFILCGWVAFCAMGFAAQNEADTLVRVGQDGVEQPKFTKRVAPQYPARAIKERLEGYVILEVTLRKSGEVDDIVVLRRLTQSKYGFEENAIAAVKQWLFEPALKDGEPVDARMTLKIDFVLDGKGQQLELLFWDVADHQPWQKRPEAFMDKQYFKAAHESSHLQTLISVRIDGNGEVIDFELEPDFLDHFSNADMMFQKIETALAAITWKPSSNEGEGLQTNINLLIPVPL